MFCVLSTLEPGLQLAMRTRMVSSINRGDHIGDGRLPNVILVLCALPPNNLIAPGRYLRCCQRKIPFSVPQQCDFRVLSFKARRGFAPSAEWTTAAGSLGGSDDIADLCAPLVVDRFWTLPLDHLVTARAVTFFGVRSPFAVGCHSLAVSGEIVSKLFFSSARNPLQNGQPVDPSFRAFCI